MSTLCHSCCAPLEKPEFIGPSDIYCKYCTDDSGKLKPRKSVQYGIAQWLKSWQPGIDDNTALDRANHFMKAMPAWSEKN
ncbi:hypothetical protein IOQ59_19635 [Pontibacterium sp. N1Y112]|uniref:Putative zinc ribbon domain-containing protein n=1 Tax=Pontibacterium sinense TaxID=2781979 RepID=A0A8J7K0Q5_9GAMM|nr:hypothetical protein [Pontibacterium sinense]